ncbi:hypothetical protein [Helicobacter heilmannii]|uniref:hypothetical protein n=1 Tax=Helicobacter heilmannii TaxID=35817 RepID=UPI0012E3214E|nr:hypothetical protein [Helicobacter heilmannii]
MPFFNFCVRNLVWCARGGHEPPDKSHIFTNPQPVLTAGGESFKPLNQLLF